MLVFLVLFFYFFLLFFYNFCFVTRWVARRAWCGWRTSGNISWCWGASMSSLRSFSNVEVEKSLLHNEERVLGLQYNTRCVLENWGEKKGKYKCTMNYLSYRSSRLTMVTPFVFSNTIVPVHGVSSSSSSPVHLAILSSCHLALFLTTGDLYDLLSFYTNDRWVL